MFNYSNDLILGMDKIIIFSPLNCFFNLHFKYVYLNHIIFFLEADKL